jgi:aspartate aminotransferase-like enzyme
MNDITFKIATEVDELEQIHRLNYRTFVEEIPQHAPDPSGRLVDRFHKENTYLIALHGRRVVGMIALRTQRPFSLDGKLAELDTYLPQGRRLVEVRLLAIEPEWRRTPLCVTLLAQVMDTCIGLGFDTAVISGTTRQLRLYRQLGFVPFGPLVGTAGAQYQPMYLTMEAVGQAIEGKAALQRAFVSRGSAAPRPVNLMPGPVRVSPEVEAAFVAPPISHRSPAVLAQLARVRARLRDLTGARDVQVIPGSGSLATSIIAAQLSRAGAPGLVLSNGEFGERLAAEAARVGLRFDRYQLPWGTAFDLDDIAARVQRLPAGAWVWCVQHETSTGALNPVEAIAALCAAQGLRLCVDCISSLGATPVDLRGVYLASASSGKGLGAYPGLALVFHAESPAPVNDGTPSYVDLAHWARHESVPHTVSSNLLAALDVALVQATPTRMARLQAHARWLHEQVCEVGLTPIVPLAQSCLAGVTMAFDGDHDALRIGEALERRGFATSFRSQHLRARNWLQASLLGDPPRHEVERFAEALVREGGVRAVLSGAT